MDENPTERIKTSLAIGEALLRTPLIQLHITVNNSILKIQGTIYFQFETDEEDSWTVVYAG